MCARDFGFGSRREWSWEECGRTRVEWIGRERVLSIRVSGIVTRESKTLHRLCQCLLSYCLQTRVPLRK